MTLALCLLGACCIGLFVWGLIGHGLARRTGLELSVVRENHRRQFREQARIYTVEVQRVGESMTGAVEAARASVEALTAECERLASQVAALAAENAALRGAHRREVASA